MALTQLKTGAIADDAVTTDKLANAINTERTANTAKTSLENDSVTLAKMAGGTDGQIITYDASGDPVAVGPGTDGQVLTSTGAGSPPAFETPAAGVGGATGVDFNDSVKIRSGTGNDLEIYHHAGDSYIRNNGGYLSFGCTNNADIQIVTNDTERMRVRNDGIVTKAIQPAFRATKTGTGFSHSAGTVPYNNEVFDKNNDYDGTDTFTAPVDGVYLFMSSIMVEHGGAGEEHHFQVNGSNANKTQWYSAGGSGTWDNNDMVCILNLSASDTVRVYVNGADLHGGIYMHFSGYLLG